jgi:hypothetical protein
METTLQTARRLLAALEELAAQEAILFRTLEFTEAVAVQERATPLVRRLGELAEEPGIGELRPRVTALLARREQSFHFLQTQIERLHLEARRIEEARARLTRMAPVYAADRYGGRRLNVAA